MRSISNDIRHESGLWVNDSERIALDGILNMRGFYERI